MILPKEIDPVKAARSEHTFEGRLPFSDFPRLKELLCLDENTQKGQIEFEWTFFVNEKQQTCASLKLLGEFPLVCERCQKPCKIKLNELIPMQVVKSEEEAENLPLAVEPILVNAENQCDTLEIIEDELILALPMIPMHLEEKDCSFSQNKAYYPAEKDNSTYKPFANLSKVFDSKE